jgi:hypothetical protein
MQDFQNGCTENRDDSNNAKGNLTVALDDGRNDCIDTPTEQYDPGRLHASSNGRKVSDLHSSKY